MVHRYQEAVWNPVDGTGRESNRLTKIGVEWRDNGLQMMMMTLRRHFYYVLCTLITRLLCWLRPIKRVILP